MRRRMWRCSRMPAWFQVSPLHGVSVQPTLVCDASMSHKHGFSSGSPPDHRVNNSPSSKRACLERGRTCKHFFTAPPTSSLPRFADLLTAAAIAAVESRRTKCVVGVQLTTQRREAVTVCVRNGQKVYRLHMKGQVEVVEICLTAALRGGVEPTSGGSNDDQGPNQYEERQLQQQRNVGVVDAS
nr:hypothetical protein CFP56_03751 [Quercus suber]